MFFLFLPLSACPKPRTAFLEEREDYEDISIDYGACPCLNWKEILSLTDDYYQVNLFLAKNNILIFQNYILSKSLYYYLIRCDICPSSVSGRRGRSAIAGQKKLIELIHQANTCMYLYINVTKPRWCSAMWSIQCRAALDLIVDSKGCMHVGAMHVDLYRTIHVRWTGDGQGVQGSIDWIQAMTAPIYTRDGFARQGVG